MSLAFGPAHPAAHGVLAVTLGLAMGKIANLEICPGLLARHSEKRAEAFSIQKALGFFERLDYVSIMSMELAFAQAAESLLGQFHFKIYKIKNIKLKLIK